MNTRRPSKLALAGIVGFTASCVGLLIFLWISFGGSLPLHAQGYRFSVEFNQAAELAPDAAVTIAGVPVGHVVSVSLDRRTGLDRAVLEIGHAFAPRPADTRAILRQKTLLGETYVQLSAGNPHGPMLRDGAALPPAQVQRTVQLDEILNTFDPRTRRAFQTWMQQGGIALTDRGEQFNQAFAELYPFARNVDAVLAVLRAQGTATRTLLADSGQVFSALAASPAQLQSLIRGSAAVFAATAGQSAALTATLRALPAFLRQMRASVARASTFSQTTQPLVDELRPAALALTPALRSLATAAPELRTLMQDVGPLDRAVATGFPAVRTFLDRSVPFLGALTPYLGNLVPVIDYLDIYRHELAAFFANGAAATQGTGSASRGVLHYVRVSNPINPEVLTAYPSRPETNRSNPYLQAGGYRALRRGLPVFARYLCTDNPLPAISPTLDSSTSTTSVAGTVLTLGQLIRDYYYTADPSGPACRAQRPLGSTTTGVDALFPHLQPLRQAGSAR